MTPTRVQGSRWRWGWGGHARPRRVRLAEAGVGHPRALKLGDGGARRPRGGFFGTVEGPRALHETGNTEGAEVGRHGGRGAETTPRLIRFEGRVALFGTAEAGGARAEGRTEIAGKAEVRSGGEGDAEPPRASAASASVETPLRSPLRPLRRVVRRPPASSPRPRFQGGNMGRRAHSLTTPRRHARRAPPPDRRAEPLPPAVPAARQGPRTGARAPQGPPLCGCRPHQTGPGPRSCCTGRRPHAAPEAARSRRRRSRARDTRAPAK